MLLKGSFAVPLLSPKRLLLSLALAVAACSSGADEKPAAKQSEPMVAKVLLTEDAKDLKTFARPAEARVTHVALDLAPDFAAKRIGGTATLDLQAAPDAQEIVLDSKGLEIEAVTDAEGQPLGLAARQGDPNAAGR